jgi:hypothetical protein
LRIILLSSLMTFLVAEMTWLEFGRRRPRPSGVTAAIAIPPQSAPEPLVRYSAIVTGDLFAEARRPNERVLSRIAVQSPGESGALRVVAIIVTDTDRVALVELAGAAEPVRLRQGDRAGPYRVLAIDPDTITVETNGLTEVFAIPSQDVIETGDASPAPTPPQQSSAPSAQGGTPNAAQGQEINRLFLEMRALDKPDPTVAPSSPQPPAAAKS